MSAPFRNHTPRSDWPTHGWRLAKVAAAKGRPFMPWQRLAADVAHEIKNPLTSLKSAVEPMRRATPEQRERRLANEAWLQRVPDDPGALLRARFLLEQQRRRGGGP